MCKSSGALICMNKCTYWQAAPRRLAMKKCDPLAERFIPLELERLFFLARLLVEGAFPPPLPVIRARGPVSMNPVECTSHSFKEKLHHAMFI